MTPAVGADIEALCGKCGEVWHVVFAKEGEKIAKVQCKQCMGYHRYRNPKGASAADKAPRALRPEREAKEPRERRSAARIAEPLVAANRDKPIAPYRASEKYELGDRLSHPSFGEGVVEKIESGKITVFFGIGRKVLASAKGIGGELSDGLAKPKRIDHANPSAGGKPVSDLK